MLSKYGTQWPSAKKNQVYEKYTAVFENNLLRFEAAVCPFNDAMLQLQAHQKT